MHGERLRLLAGASLLFVLGCCAVLALVHDGGGERGKRTMLDGIDAYLAAKYGAGGGGMQSFRSLQAAVSGHHAGDLPMQMSIFGHHQAHQAHRDHTAHARALGRGRMLENEVGGYPRELGIMTTSTPSARGGDRYLFPQHSRPTPARSRTLVPMIASSPWTFLPSAVLVLVTCDNVCLLTLSAASLRQKPAP